jgi:cell division protein FtsI/penicillin-binding protein 2
VSQDSASEQEPTFFEQGRVRDELGVSARTLEIVREAMLADVEDTEGTGRRAAVPGMSVCGKTGTAQVGDERNQVVDWITWFASFAPYDNPRYTVVVMVESAGASGRYGGTICAPIAQKIYQAVQRMEQRTLAQAR